MNPTDEGVSALSWACSNSSGGLLAAPVENVVGLILRSIKPLDLRAIVNSIKKTQRLLLVESGYLAAGAIFTSDSSLRASAVTTHLLALAGVSKSTRLSFGPAHGRDISFMIKGAALRADSPTDSEQV